MSRRGSGSEGHDALSAPNPPQPSTAWWKEQLEAQMEIAGALRRAGLQKAPSNRRRGSHRRKYSESASDSEDYGNEHHYHRRETEEDLRDALRAARRQLDAGARREKALRRALRVTDLPPVSRPTSRGDEGDAVQGAAATFDDAPRGDAARDARQQAGAGLLNRMLMESGVLLTEEGREQVAELLAKAAMGRGSQAGALGQAPPLSSRTPLPPPPSQPSSSHLPPRMPTATAGAGVPPPAMLPSARASPPTLPSPAAVVPPPQPPPIELAALDAIFASLLDSVLSSEAPRLVKRCVRQAVQDIIPTRTASVDGGIYGQLYALMLFDVIAGEAAAVVGEAVASVADDYLACRSAERVLEGLIGDLMHDELKPIVEQARIAVVMERLLDDAMAAIARDVSVVCLHEARGSAARVRTVSERALVTEVAQEGLFERLCLQRLLQHIANDCELLLLQSQAARLLDELIAEGLGRRALAVGQDVHELHNSAVLSEAHHRIAYAAIVDEFLAQLRSLSASGLEAGIPVLPSETDTDEEDDEAQ